MVGVAVGVEIGLTVVEVGFKVDNSVSAGCREGWVELGIIVGVVKVVEGFTIVGMEFGSVVDVAVLSTVEIAGEFLVQICKLGQIVLVELKLSLSVFDALWF